ncbi:MAG: PorP/SprF family type IX secretion system membrane protein [Bacteroidia bacterium]
MKIQRVSGLIFLLAIGFISSAQQVPLLSNYYVNPYLSNPALAGSKGGNIFILNRSKWNSAQSNPETFLGTADGMLANGTAGYGAMVYNDKTNILGKTGALGTYSYKIALPHSSQLSFGVSLGLEQTRILKDRIKEVLPVELSLLGDVSQVTTFDANLGVAYQIKGLNVGVATYQLFNNNNVELKEGFEDKYNYRFNRHLVGTASYRIVAKSETFFIDPILQVKAGKGMAPQTSINAIGNYKNMVWAGAGYRQNYGMDFMAGVLLFDKLTVGYSYGMATGNTKKNTPTAHEIIIGLKLIKNNSNIDTDKDGVTDNLDREPSSPAGCKVDKLGVSADADMDRIPDCLDKQNNTPTGAPVDAEGVALDTDKDGVIDMYDREPATIAGCLVDNFGVAVDGDKDEVPDCRDKELNSHWAAKVDADGVAEDTDKDGVQDVLDLELETPHWQHAGEQQNANASKCIVDAHGITKDSDGDGVPDCVDAELLTPKGAKVNKKGASLKKQEDVIPEKSSDTDGDGIADELDLEPNTPTGASVDQWGRSPLVNTDPAEVHRIEIEEIEDNSNEWDYYVIVGVFRYYNNLKNYQKYLLKTYDESTQVLVTEQNYYYVWTKQITTKADAKSEVERLTQARLKDYIVGNPWMWREPKKK